MIVQKGNDILVQMSVLCGAPKSDCDKLVVEFEALNKKMRDDLIESALPDVLTVRHNSIASPYLFKVEPDNVVVIAEISLDALVAEPVQTVVV